MDAELRPWALREARRLRVRGAAWARAVAMPVEGCHVLCEVEDAPRVEGVYQLTVWGGERKLGVRIFAQRRYTVRQMLERYWYPHRVNPWHEARAAAVGRGLVAKLDACGVREVAVACKCCGRAELRTVPCGDKLCGGCSRKFYGKLKKKMLRASGHAMREARHEAWRRLRMVECEDCTAARRARAGCEGAPPARHPAHAEGNARPQLWTLTVAHQETATATRDAITRGWVRLRAWLQKQLGRSVPFALVWESTDGLDGRAHVHAHVLVLAPPLCWSWLSREWQSATEGKGAGVGHATGRLVSAVRCAAYMAKYATKGTVERGSPALAAEVYSASYGRRRFSTSRGWWVLEEAPRTACCAAGYAVVAIAARHPRERSEGDAFDEHATAVYAWARERAAAWFDARARRLGYGIGHPDGLDVRASSMAGTSEAGT